MPGDYLSRHPIDQWSRCSRSPPSVLLFDDALFQRSSLRNFSVLHRPAGGGLRIGATNAWPCDTELCVGNNRPSVREVSQQSYSAPWGVQPGHVVNFKRATFLDYGPYLDGPANR